VSKLSGKADVLSPHPTSFCLCNNSHSEFYYTQCFYKVSEDSRLQRCYLEIHRNFIVFLNNYRIPFILTRVGSRYDEICKNEVITPHFLENARSRPPARTSTTEIFARASQGDFHHNSARRAPAPGYECPLLQGRQHSPNF
jgi:hypothetical protein